jgi:16S rRNA processing protein RimM
MIPPLTRIGRIAGKHGFRGEMNIALDDESTAKILKKGNFLFIEIDGKGVPFLIEGVSGNTAVVKLADIDTEEDVKSLAGNVILIESSKVKQQATFSWDNLKGFTIKDTRTDFEGAIEQVEIYPQGPIMLVKKNNKSHLIPIVEEWIIRIEEDKNQIFMELPEGLTEL